ncbi:MAG: endonuclease/exonuclease/phosphatase family protein [Myxococcales bacterium]|nr:endonuclease/exonuclease/phosphatase family protein [Myxococcales bacterium]MCB9576145.1 endonuclease/exonuclease/phosphatase family protein [Polyangiaceae bacterium]
MTSPDTLRIATLNVWNKSGPWAERLRLIRTQLRELSPDVIGLQEVLRLVVDGTPNQAPEHDQATEIAQGFRYHIAYAAAADYGGGLMFGNALLSKHPIVEQRVLPLPGAETGESRSMLYALVETPAGLLPVFVTHLNWKLHHGSVRVQQVRAIVEKVFELAPVDETRLPPVLMGDFNAEPHSDEIRHLTGHATLEGESVYFADAWVYAGDGGPGYTFDRENRFAALAHEPPRRIDYIFVRGPDRKFRGEPLSTRLAFATSEPSAHGLLWPSDHFGLVTNIAVSARER